MENWFRGFVTVTLLIYLIILVTSAIRDSNQEVNSKDFLDTDPSERFQVFVSNLDGKVTAIDAKNGDVLWSLDVGTKPLLSSSISNIQMITNGSPSRLIPSLDGGLYRMDGEGVEPIPLAADVLLTSTYKLTDDSSIVGGKEIEIYGVDINTGKLRYTCSSDRCHQVANLDDASSYKSQEVLVIKRTDRTIRLVDVIEGHEKWNFSVGQVDMLHHVKSDSYPTITGESSSSGHYQDQRENPSDFHPRFHLLHSDNIAIKVKMPTRTLLAADRNSQSHVYWKHQFDSSIAGAWIMKGREFFPLNLFEDQRQNEGEGSRPQNFMYIGMYNEMLYVQPSAMLEMHQVSDGSHGDGDDVDDVAEFDDDNIEDGGSSMDTEIQVHMPRVKWKPYIATAPSRTRIISDQKTQNTGIKSDLVHHPANPRDKSLALLSKNQYPFDSGYYLYLDYSPIEDYALCRNTTPFKKSKREEFVAVLSRKWKELSLFLFIGMASLFTFLRRKFQQFKRTKDASSGRSTASKSCSVQHDLETPGMGVQRESSLEEFESSPQQFVSRYRTDFQQQECLGKGGFGVVFKAYNKIDECSYAIKRIALKDSKTAREKVMREVKALAKLDHPGIVRYYQSWLECPPPGWIEQNDDLSCRSTSMENETSDLISSRVAVPRTNFEGVRHPVGSTESEVYDFRVDLSPPSDEDGKVVLTMEKSSSDFVESDGGSNSWQKSDTVEFASDSELIQESESYCLVGGHKQDSLRRRGTTPSDSSIVFVEKSRPVGQPTHNSNNNNYEVSKISDKGYPKKFNRDFSKASDEPRKLYLYIQMQLCKQESLREWLNDSAFEKDQTYDIFHQIVSAICYVHNQALMHRDLKPSNIFFAMDGTIKIGDFGLVADVENICEDLPAGDHLVKTAKRHTNQVGTQLYMSPELSSGGNYTHKVDIYALGVIFVEMFQRFSTHMERVTSLEQLRRLIFPESFISAFKEEYEFVKPLLSHNPDDRPEAGDLLKQKLLSNYEESSNLFRRLHRSRTISVHSNSSGTSPLS